jgi:hypothetical protein
MEFFTQYGPVFQLNILRDKESEESKGKEYYFNKNILDNAD